MAGLKPSFITGGNAKVVLGGLTLAYATDVSYRADTQTIPVEVMGRYEVVSNEPIATTVSGSMSIVRYTTAATPGAALDATNMPAAALDGNDIGKAAKFDHFNPKEILLSKTFDVEVFQRIAEGADIGETNTKAVSVVKVRDCRFTSMGGSVNKRGILVEQFSFVGILLDTGETPSTRTEIETDLS